MTFLNINDQRVRLEAIERYSISSHEVTEGVFRSRLVLYLLGGSYNTYSLDLGTDEAVLSELDRHFDTRVLRETRTVVEAANVQKENEKTIADLRAELLQLQESHQRLQESHQRLVSLLKEAQKVLKDKERGGLSLPAREETGALSLVSRTEGQLSVVEHRKRYNGPGACRCDDCLGPAPSLKAGPQ